MKISDLYRVESLKAELCKDWLLNVHYAKRIPSISFSFGLFYKDEMVGVCTYGRPVAHSLIKGAFSGGYQDKFLELNRLCVNEGLDYNALSFFVSKTLKKIPKPKVIVSYADTSKNHNGYIYQATNWIYTGLSAKRKDYMVKGLEHLHSASIMDLVGRGDKSGHINKVEELKIKFGRDNVYTVDRPRKHRYFYLLGNKRDVKNMSKLLAYDLCEYPKGENERYDIKYKPQTQTQLF
jgi:hypothetical protein